MKITLLTVGKIKEKYFTMAIDEYAKRLSRYVKLDIVEVADEKTPDGASETEERMIRDKEGKRILSNLKEDSYVITLEIEGKMLDSVELSKKINHNFSLSQHFPPFSLHKNPLSAQNRTAPKNKGDFYI